MLSTLVLSAVSTLTMAQPNFTNNILITGYWPPTNNMLRPFSTNTASNPSGWQGGNWQNSGYDVYSFFPEFPGQTGPNWGRGSGDFEVDYQDTYADWNRIIAEVRPVAIVTFSRANTTIGWELEPAAQRFRLPGESNPPGRSVPIYTVDYADNNGATAPDERYPFIPEIQAIAPGTIFNSTLPMQAIVNAVAAQVSPSVVDPFIAPYNPATPNTYDFGGGFLSGFMSMLGTRYQSLNSGPEAAWRTFAAGHIHVGTNMSLPAATLATEITLQTLITHLDTVIPAPGVAALAGLGAAAGVRRKRRAS